MAGRSVLFVCDKNFCRSPTAETVFKEMVHEAGYSVMGIGDRIEYDFEIGSAGINRAYCESVGTRCMSKELGDKFGEIFAMDEYIEAALVREYKQPQSKIVNLSIRDHYPMNHPELVAILRCILEPFVHENKEIGIPPNYQRG